jgi:hypothetical protein
MNTAHLVRSASCAVLGSLIMLVACSSSNTPTSADVGDGGVNNNRAGCPSEVPDAGTSCALAAGTVCSYDCAHGKGYNSSATCEKGAWSVSASLSPCSAAVTCDADAGCIETCEGGQCRCDCSRPDAGTGDAGPPVACTPGGNACGDGLECLCCGSIGPKAICICTTACSGSTSCSDPARPSCNSPPNSSTGICTTTGFNCCWQCQ